MAGQPARNRSGAVARCSSGSATRGAAGLGRISHAPVTHSQTRAASARNRTAGISRNETRKESLDSQCGCSGRMLPGISATVLAVSCPVNSQSSREAG